MAQVSTRSVGRSAARLGAVQALYQMDMAQTDLTDVLAEFEARGVEMDGGEDEPTKVDVKLFRDVVSGVVQHQRTLDPMIDGVLAEGWTLARVDSILRAVLRAGAYELTLRRDIPPKVVISEYIDVAHAFFDNDEPRFVNGALDRLARTARAAEMDRGPAG
jgi:N utilization substance protein B